MKKEAAKAIGGGALMGVGAAMFMTGLTLIIVPGLGVVLTGIGGALAFAGGAGATGASVAAALTQGAAVKRGVYIGECKIIVESETDENGLKLKLQKVGYDEADERDCRTIMLCKEHERSLSQGEGLSFELGGKAFSCATGDFKAVCGRYLATLQIPGVHLDRSYDKCFCKSCCEERGDGHTFMAGEPRKACAVARGCMKFGIKLQTQAVEKDVFNKWHGCYHGTAPENIVEIISLGRLIKPGDINPEGASLTIPIGHIQEGNPQGHDVKQVFFSPPLLYTIIGDVYAKERRYTDPVTRKKYIARTILQVRIKPGSYKIGAKTTSGNEPIDEPFSNEEIEWSTNREGVHHIYGILIHMRAV